ncbi:MAG TPA: hypothetical protein VLJ68_13195, partial [Chitinophagaceae bacterium]|nr:hypothetical protein [Chitinophagaceae bacterium]
KDVFAIPGKLSDPKSAGCNELIRNNKAILLSDAKELIEMLNWEEKKLSPKKQRELFIELSPDERLVIDILRESETVHIDDLNFKSGLSSSTIAAALLSLELQSVIVSLPGKMYKLY